MLVVQALCEQIWSDPGWNGGEYRSNAEVVGGLTRHAHLWAVMGFSTEFWKQELWRALEFESKEAFLEGFLESYFTVMDPNDLLCMAWKGQRGDVTRHTGGDLAAALGRITAKTFVLPISEDMFFPVRDCAAEQALVPDSELRVVDDLLGHLGLFGVAPTYIGQIDEHLGELLRTGGEACGAIRHRDCAAGGDAISCLAECSHLGEALAVSLSRQEEVAPQGRHLLTSLRSLASVVVVAGQGNVFDRIVGVDHEAVMGAGIGWDGRVVDEVRLALGVVQIWIGPFGFREVGAVHSDALRGVHRVGARDRHEALGR
ncbi:MAG: hypothetical protein ACRDSP_16865 [Pseudonocardiaceae bacterium]